MRKRVERLDIAPNALPQRFAIHGEYAVAREGQGSDNAVYACPGDLTRGPSASGVRTRWPNESVLWMSTLPLHRTNVFLHFTDFTALVAINVGRYLESRSDSPSSYWSS